MLILLRDACSMLRFAVFGIGHKNIKYFLIVMFFVVCIYNYLLFCVYM